MGKVILFVVLSIVFIPSCSRKEDDKNNTKKQNQQFYVQPTINQKLQKEFFELQLENAESLLNEKEVYKFKREVYNSIDGRYMAYLEGPEINYRIFNKNGQYLVFPFNDKGFIYGTDIKDITIFKYDNKIYTLGSIGDYYIDTKNMYFFTSLEDKWEKEMFEEIPKEYQCKISIQEDNKIKFYNETCEKRIKQMLKIIPTNEDNSKDINDIAQEVYETIKEKYKKYINNTFLNLEDFNKNGTMILFEINFDFDKKADKYLNIFNYNNNIFITKTNIAGNIFFINIKQYYFLPDISKDSVAKLIFDNNNQNDFCKISIQEDNKIKFYNENCEKRIKQMLKMDFQK